MTTDRRRTAFRLLGSALLVLCLGSVGLADDTKAVPEGRPIQLDGLVSDAEWGPAPKLPLGDGESTLRLMQYRGSLMIGFESKLPWPRRSDLQLYFAPEKSSKGTRSPGVVSIAFEPFAHDRAHLQVFHNGADGTVRLLDRVVVRGAFHEKGCSLEMGLKLDVLGITKAKRGPLRFCAFWPHPNLKGPTWPAGLDFRGKPGTPPPAMASTKTWGTLEGFGDPSGPGAFSKTDWEAWIERDRNIRNLAQGAYGAFRLLDEEWEQTRKEDGVIEEEILTPLRALGRLEPLTAGDLLAVARTLRFLNRHERSLGVYDALVNDRNRATAQFALWQRAQTREAAEDFEGAADDWQALADAVIPRFAARYAKGAERARRLHAAWQLEQERRAACTAAGDLPKVELHTNRGVILLGLFAKDVPNAVKHFLALVERKFYDGTSFHRVHGEFMAQGGKGTSPPTIELEQNERHGFWRGAVGFANRQLDPRNGSQFFLMTAPKPDLGNFTCFGYVIAGQDVVDRLAVDDVIEKIVAVPAGK